MSDEDMIRRGDAKALFPTIDDLRHMTVGHATVLFAEKRVAINAIPAVQPTVSPDVAALVEAVTALRDAMRDNIIKNDEPHTVVLPDGSRHSGPVVDFLHTLLGAQISVLDAALARVKGVM